MEAIILMAGNSSRLNSSINKVYLELNNKMVFLYSLEKLLKYVDKVHLVIREQDLDYIKPYLSDKVDYVIGGSHREESVYNAIKNIDKNNKVLIHDGARPLISTKTIENIIKLSQDYDLILPYLNMKYTIYNKNNFNLVNRDDLILAQTPQLVRVDHFIDSYNKAVFDKFIATDDISLILKYYPNSKIYKLLDEETNIKITTKEDINLASYLLEKMAV